MLSGKFVWQPFGCGVSVGGIYGCAVCKMVPALGASIQTVARTMTAEQTACKAQAVAAVMADAVQVRDVLIGRNNVVEHLVGSAAG